MSDLTVDASTGDLSCLTRVHGVLTIETDAKPETIASLANLTQAASMLLYSSPLADLSTFACLESIDTLGAHHMPQLVDVSLPSLVHLRSLTLSDIGITKLPTFAPGFKDFADLQLYQLPTLADLSPAAAWGVAPTNHWIHIEDCPEITSLTGLEALATGDSLMSLRLRNNAKLSSLAALEGSTKIDYDVNIAYLPALTSLDGLKNLSDAGNLWLDGLPLIQDLSSFSKLTTVQSLQFGDCALSEGLDQITSLAGLDSLSKVDSLYLTNNDNLESLSGAPMLTEVSYTFSVYNNPKLSQKAFETLLGQLNPAPNVPCYSPLLGCECDHV